jgi:general stress protein YciG
MENIFLSAFYSISLQAFRGTSVAAQVLEHTARRNLVAKEDRGFASMDRSKQRDIASKGGKAAHQKGTAHEWTSEEAREAGRKGGMASHRRKQEQQEQQTPEGDPTDGNTPESTIGGTVNPEAMMGTDNLP